MMQLDMGAAGSYVLLSLLFLCSFNIFLADLTKDKDTVQYLNSGWAICSSCVACMVFLSAMVRPLLNVSMMACSCTLLVSCITCCLASIVSNFN